MRSNVGIYNLHMQAMGGGEKLTLVLAEHLSRTHNVSLFCAQPLDVPSVEQFFGVDLSRVTITPLNSAGKFWPKVGRLLDSRGPAFSLHHYRQLRKLNLDLFINNSYGSGLMCPAAQGIFMCMFPHEAPRSSGDGTTTVDSYSIVVAISQYSAHWVQKLWGRRSEVIYPPCDDMGPPSSKENVVLHVGRFIADTHEDERHHKAQRLMLDAFKQMTDLHRNGWELHFAGSIGSVRRSEAFANALVKSADGLPVFFHFNESRDKLRALYRRAAIYWHATGYGFDADNYPARQEHFGISTVEAMSAGAVPVVYPSGGQKEIVTDGVNGFWWDDIEELTSKTRILANDLELRCRLSEHAIASGKRFGREAFAAKVDQLIAELLPERG